MVAIVRCSSDNPLRARPCAELHIKTKMRVIVLINNMTHALFVYADGSDIESPCGTLLRF
jgi:hypothetical protein